MNRLVGRAKETDILESAFGKQGAFVVYGRRRIGKTFLLRNFCENKRHLYFTCLDSEDNLQYFTDTVSNFLGRPLEVYSNFYSAFSDIGKICAEEPTVVVIDEFQFLAARNRSILSYVQQFADCILTDTDSMLVLCGSSIRFMKMLETDGSNPLYGRFRKMLRIGPLSLTECMDFHSGMSETDVLKLYLTVGGIPKYHDESDSVFYEECIKENFLSDGWMCEEANSLIGSEFNPPDRYRAVLSAISGGAVSLKEISEKVKVDESTCLGYLKELRKAEIVDIVNPMKGAPKRSIYFVRDHLLAFHYEVMVRRRYLISNGDADSAYGEIEPYIDTYFGRRFEIFCEEFIVKNYPTVEIGKWWMDIPSKDIHEDIDIVARISVSGVKYDLFAECKFTRNPVGFHEYNILERRVENRMEDSNRRLCLISLSGFERELIEFADKAHVILIGPDELFGRKKVPSL